jgi:hypothetical protein
MVVFSWGAVFGDFARVAKLEARLTGRIHKTSSL